MLVRDIVERRLFLEYVVYHLRGKDLTYQTTYLAVFLHDRTVLTNSEANVRVCQVRENKNELVHFRYSRAWIMLPNVFSLVPFQEEPDVEGFEPVVSDFVEFTDT